jgi:hypothetical protein
MGKTMPYDLCIEEKDNYIRVEASGNRVPGRLAEDAIQLWAKVSEHCRVKNISNILAIYNISGNIPSQVIIDVTRNPESFGWNKSLKLALVDLNEDSRKGNYLTEAIAARRGYAFRVFDNEEEARAWLID